MMDPVASLRTALRRNARPCRAQGWRSISLCTAGHYAEDVAPFRFCPLDTYLKYRPPDNRNNCPKNP